MPEEADLGPKKCSVGECDRPAKSRGWCNTHYERWRRSGVTDNPYPEYALLCGVSGCSKTRHTREWCRSHYERVRRYGDPLGKPSPRPARPYAGERVARFWSKVDIGGGPDACWPWTAGGLSSGYASMHWGPGTQRRSAHRIAWFLVHGSWPVGVIDHTCHNGTGCNLSVLCPHRRCCNPAHLEDVPHQVNVLRGNAPSAKNAARTECINGHPLSGSNLRVSSTGRRRCRACDRARSLRDYYAQREAQA